MCAIPSPAPALTESSASDINGTIWKQKQVIVISYNTLAEAQQAKDDFYDGTNIVLWSTGHTTTFYAVFDPYAVPDGSSFPDLATLTYPNQVAYERTVFFNKDAGSANQGSCTP